MIAESPCWIKHGLSFASAGPAVEFRAGGVLSGAAEVAGPRAAVAAELAPLARYYRAVVAVLSIASDGQVVPKWTAASTSLIRAHFPLAWILFLNDSSLRYPSALYPFPVTRFGQNSSSSMNHGNLAFPLGGLGSQTSM